ncbi:MAG: DUF5684 domain-containing protein [Erysipelotrichaceae bacterium]|nr:DUF5684 domain-containing protein [Erysipelotrichaceae bacterium]
MDILFLIYTILKMIIYPRDLAAEVIVISAVLLGLEFYGIYLIFRKAGKKLWKAFFPFYNLTEIYGLCWDKKYSYIYLFFGILSAALSFHDGRLLQDPVLGIPSILCFVIAYSIHASMKLKLARSFGGDIYLIYGLIFMEAVFFFVLGLNENKYIGPCFSNKKISFKKPKLTLSQKAKRSYMISLYRKRSYIALFSGSLLVLLNLRAISRGLLNQYLIKANDQSYSFLNYFTVNSALLSSLGAAFMIPYAIEGIRKKRFVLPKWVTLFQYAGASCTSVTMSFAFTFIYLSSGAETAFGGPNFWMHVICPILSLALFFSVEIDRTLSVRDSLIAMSPFFLYAVFYMINAIFIGPENGGWSDFYKFTEWIPATFSLPMVFIFSFFIASAIRLIYNRLSKKRTEHFINSLGPDISEIEINIEIYGLGRYNGQRTDLMDMTIPFDIFIMLNEKYGVDIDNLSVIYNKGVIDGLKERKDYKNPHLQALSDLIGYPVKQ